MLNHLFDKSNDKNALPFRLERFQGMYAVLVFETINESERQEIFWPIHKLPEGSRIGQQVWLQLSNTNTRSQEKAEILRKLLEELVV